MRTSVTRPENLSTWCIDPVVITAARTLHQHSLLDQTNLRKALPRDYASILDQHPWKDVVYSLTPHLEAFNLEEVIHQGIESAKKLQTSFRALVENAIYPNRIVLTEADIRAFQALVTVIIVTLERSRRDLL